MRLTSQKCLKKRMEYAVRLFTSRVGKAKRAHQTALRWMTRVDLAGYALRTLSDQKSMKKTPQKATAKTASKPDTYASVWDALADTPEEAANLRARAELMQKIAAIVKDSGWTQLEAAQQCGVTQPRMNDLLRGRVSRFSLDALVNIATAIGRRVHVELEVV
jgi:predicted XRE-type DNA-binding protein